MINISEKYKFGLGGRLIFLVVAVALLALLFIMSPTVKFPLVFYKLSLVTIGAILGYYLDMVLFPNFRPKDLADDIEEAKSKSESAAVMSGLYQVASSALIRRAIIVGAAIFAVSRGI